MDVIQFIPQFLYRIRYRLLWGSLIVTALVIYFTQFLPFSYTVNSNIYAGVTNATSITEERFDYFSVNSTFDNIINIGKSKGTLEKYQPACLPPVWCMATKKRHSLHPCQTLPPAVANHPKGSTGAGRPQISGENH